MEIIRYDVTGLPCEVWTVFKCFKLIIRAINRIVRAREFKKRVFGENNSNLAKTWWNGFLGPPEKSRKVSELSNSLYGPFGGPGPQNFSKFQVFRNIDILCINRIVVEDWLTIYNFEVTKIIFYPPMTSSQWSLNFLKMQIFCEIYTYYTSIELFLNTDCQFITFKLRKLFYEIYDVITAGA